MVVARPVEPTSEDFRNINRRSSIVPTRLLTDPSELDNTLLRNGIGSYSENDILYANDNSVGLITPETDGINGVNELNILNINRTRSCSPIGGTKLFVNSIDIDIEYELPETERISVELNKNECGLGITVAGYVCEREDLSGIFVKSLHEGSDAYKNGKIAVNDRIIEVDGESLQECTNHQAVEKLKRAGDVVRLTLERYLRGPKFEQLQEALACQETRDFSPPSPTATTLSWIPIDTEV